MAARARFLAMTLVGTHNPLLRIARAAAGLFSPPRPLKKIPAEHPVWVIGHRGSAREKPENTIESFARAAELGADGIETDICVTSDGRFILWHDADPGGEIALARQAGREELAFTPDVPSIGSPWRRAVRELTFEDFRRHYGYTPRRGGLSDLVAHDGPPDVPFATLEDLFQWADRESRIRHLVLDVKLEGPDLARAKELLELVRGWVSRPSARPDLTVHYLNPHREVLRPLSAHVAAHPLPPRLHLHADFELPGVRRAARRLGLRHVSMGAGQRFWNEFRAEVASVGRARRRGKIDELIVWTINEEKRLREMIDRGVDGILTDDPKMLRTLLPGTVSGSAASGKERAAASV
jgi:glycerophosphoryl diester phosphodiesterase